MTPARGLGQVSGSGARWGQRSHFKGWAHPLAWGRGLVLVGGVDAGWAGSPLGLRFGPRCKRVGASYRFFEKQVSVKHCFEAVLASLTCGGLFSVLVVTYGRELAPRGRGLPPERRGLTPRGVASLGA